MKIKVLLNEEDISDNKKALGSLSVVLELMGTLNKIAEEREEVDNDEEDMSDYDETEAEPEMFVKERLTKKEKKAMKEGNGIMGIAIERIEKGQVCDFDCRNGKISLAVMGSGK